MNWGAKGGDREGSVPRCANSGDSNEVGHYPGFSVEEIGEGAEV
jgi:hypothetical protein